MKAICSSCEAIRQMTSDYSDPSILCPVCRALDPSHSGTHKARRDDDDEDDDDRPRKKKPAASSSDDDDEDDDRPRKKKPASSDSNTGSKVAGAAAGMGIGMIVVIVVGLLGCCVCLPATGVGLTWMAINKAKNAVESAVMVNNMREVGMASLRHNDLKNHIASPKMQPSQLGKPAPELSWRLTILENQPFQGAAARFDRTQDWDSPKNKPFLSPMPSWYLNPVKEGVDGTQSQTQVQYFTGANTPFPSPDTKLKMIDITGGTSNKFMCAEATTPVPWAKPADMVVAAQGKLPMAEGKFVAAMFDGTVRIVNRSNASDEILRKVIDPKADQPWQEKWNN